MPRKYGGYAYGSPSNTGFGPRSSKIQTKPPTQPQTPDPSAITSKVPPPLMLSGVVPTLAHGLAFGAGSEVALQAVQGIMGPSYQTVYVQQLDSQAPNKYSHSHIHNKLKLDLPCMKQVNEFGQCLQQNEHDISNCQFFSFQLKECKAESEKKRWEHLHQHQHVHGPRHH